MITLPARPKGPVEIPSGVTARGSVAPPPSKSVSHRYLNLALLAGGSTRIENLLRADDTRLFVEALRQIGFAVDRSSEDRGVDLRAPTDLWADDRSIERRLECGNAGTMFRLIVGTLAALPGVWTVDGSERLRERPIAPLVDALRQLGADIEYLAVGGHCPLRLVGGSLIGGECQVDAGMSSQYLSALLMAAVRCRKAVTIEASALVSSPYVDLTVAALARLGVEVERDGLRFRVEAPADLRRPDTLTVEADYSAAAYPVAAALITDGDVELIGLDPSSAQGDRQFLETLEAAGARLDWRGNRLHARGGSIAPVDVDLSATPDQVPTLAAVAAFARGASHIRNVPHLRVKESDRLHAMATELGRLGIAVRETGDGLVVHGTGSVRAPQPTSIECYDDHRIAMSMALVGLRCSGVVISEPDVVAKSYPDFWRDLKRLIG